MSGRCRRPTDAEILAAVVAVADDGYCDRRDVAARLRGFGERDLIRSIARAARRNLIHERRDAEGRTHLALTAEGWRVHRDVSEGSADGPIGWADAESGG